MGGTHHASHDNRLTNEDLERFLFNLAHILLR